TLYSLQRRPGKFTLDAFGERAGRDRCSSISFILFTAQVLPWLVFCHCGLHLHLETRWASAPGSFLENIGVSDFITSRSPSARKNRPAKCAVSCSIIFSDWAQIFFLVGSWRRCRPTKCARIFEPK